MATHNQNFAVLQQRGCEFGAGCIEIVRPAPGFGGRVIQFYHLAACDQDFAIGK